MEKSKTLSGEPRKGFFWPGVDALPPSPPSVHWTWWRWLLLGIALLGSAYFFVTVCGITLGRILAFFQPHEGRITYAVLGESQTVQSLMVRDLTLLAAAAVVLGCLYAIAGKWAAGVAGGQHWQQHRIGLGYYMRAVYSSMLIVGFLQAVVLLSFPGLQNYTSKRLGTLPVWYESFFSLATAFIEEVIATVFLYWLLEQIRMRSRTITLAATGWGTAIIVLTHWSYHAHYGIAVLPMLVSVYFTVICWRYTRSLPAIVVGHMLWNAQLAFFQPMLAIAMQAVLAAIGFFVLDWPWKKSKTAKAEYVAA